jgi:hypothetical protein
MNKDGEQEFTLNGKLSDDMLVKVGNRYFQYADTDGSTYIEFNEAEGVYDATSHFDGSEADHG